MRLSFALLKWALLALGALGLGLGLRAGTWLWRGPGLLAGGLLLVLGLLLLYWSMRPNRAQAAPALALETWTVADDGAHNAFTDLLAWRGSLRLAHISSPTHLASDRSRLVLLRSDDARRWQEMARLDGGGEDIRDPKLAVVHDRLFLYALLNRKLDPEPYKTVVSQSDDGATWTPFADISAPGWLLGRPRTGDGATWYTPAHRLDHDQAALLRSSDGLRWTLHSLIHQGDGADEAAAEFLPDGYLLATVRLEMDGGVLGHRQGGTLIATAAPPFETWTPLARSLITRLDGPNLFAHGGKVYAVGRYQPHVAGPFQWQGSVLSRKRTALFLISPTGSGLVHLSDLPSAGDTAYAGLVQQRFRRSRSPRRSVQPRRPDRPRWPPSHLPRHAPSGLPRSVHRQQHRPRSLVQPPRASRDLPRRRRPG